MLDKTGDRAENLPVRRAIAAICRSTPITLGLGLMVVLASCGHGDCDLGYYGECTVGGAADELSFGLVAGDFNGTGRSSIIQASLVVGGEFSNTDVYGSYSFDTGSYLKSYQSTGPGTFAAPVLISDGHNPLYLAAADLNGDHLPDVVSVSFDDGAVSIFLNNGASPGTFEAPLVLSSPGASQVAVADVNGDGLVDIISADFDGIPDLDLTDSTGVKVLMHVGATSSTSYAAATVVYNDTGPPGSWGTNLIAIADVNGDGLNDLVITDTHPYGGTSPAVEVLLQNPASHGTFLPAVSYPVASESFPQSIAVTDSNGDGLADVIVGGSDAVSVLLQSSTSPGTFATAANYAVSNANEIAVADINGDGRPDIVIATGVNHPVQYGFAVNQPGVLLQSSTAPGTFLPVSDLP